MDGNPGLQGDAGAIGKPGMPGLPGPSGLRVSGIVIRYYSSKKNSDFSFAVFAHYY